MADKHHIKILDRGIEAWNAWRTENPDVTPDLSAHDLTGVNLEGAFLQDLITDGAILPIGMPKMRRKKLD